MPTSQARIDANRKNALLSTGPRTPEGKAVSRRNSLKHGLTGEGIVLPDEDVAVLSGRFEILHAELAPATAMGVLLVQRIALLSVRLDRSARQEAKRVGQAMRLASEKHEDRRSAEVYKLIDWIANEPAINLALLLRTPEGVDRLIEAWLNLDEDLAHHDLDRVAYGQWQRLENLKGRKPEDYPVSREGALFKTLWGKPEYLEPGEPDGLDQQALREWARDRLRERIAAKLAELRALRATFDGEAHAKDRVEAPQRALFDASKEGILARQYEATAERGLYRALKELRQVEAEAAAKGGPHPSHYENEICDDLASTVDDPSEEEPPTSREPQPAGRPSLPRANRGRKPARSGRRPTS